MREQIGEVQTPAGLIAGVGGAWAEREPRTRIEYFDAKDVVHQVNSHLDVALLADVFNRVRDNLGQQQPGVIEALRRQLALHPFEQFAGAPGRRK